MKLGSLAKPISAILVVNPASISLNFSGCPHPCGAPRRSAASLSGHYSASLNPPLSHQWTPRQCQSCSSSLGPLLRRFCYYSIITFPSYLPALPCRRRLTFASYSVTHSLSRETFLSFHSLATTLLAQPLSRRENTDSQNTRAPKSRSSISHSCTDSLDSGSSEHTPLYDFPSAIRYFVTGLWIRSQVTFLHQTTTPLTLISPSPANISSSTKPILTNMLVVLTDYLLRKHLSHCRKQ